MIVTMVTSLDVPSSLVASQVYMPASDDVASVIVKSAESAPSLLVMMMPLGLRHDTCGSGSPSAEQFSIMMLPRSTATLGGVVVTAGGSTGEM